MESFSDAGVMQGSHFSASLAHRDSPPLISSDCCSTRVIDVDDQSVCSRCGGACEVVVE
jgi:hypothetical protein